MGYTVRAFQSKIFVMQGRLKTGICHYHSKLVQWQWRVKYGNFAEFYKIKHLTKMTRTDLVLEISPTLCNNWKIFHSNLFYASQSWKKSPMVEMSGFFQHSLWIVSLKVLSRVIFKKIWLIWRQTAGFRPFSKKFLSGILLWKQQGMSFCWKKCCYVFSKIWSNLFLWKLWR